MRAARHRAASSRRACAARPRRGARPSAARGRAVRRSRRSSAPRRALSTSSWRAVKPAGWRASSRGRCGTRRPRSRMRAATRFVSGSAPRPRAISSDSASDVLVVEQREHQRPVVGPADLAERCRRRRASRDAIAECGNAGARDPRRLRRRGPAASAAAARACAQSATADRRAARSARSAARRPPSARGRPRARAPVSTR